MLNEIFELCSFGSSIFNAQGCALTTISISPPMSPGALRMVPCYRAPPQCHSTFQGCPSPHILPLSYSTFLQTLSSIVSATKADLPYRRHLEFRRSPNCRPDLPIEPMGSHRTQLSALQKNPSQPSMLAYCTSSFVSAADGRARLFCSITVHV